MIRQVAKFSYYPPLTRQAAETIAQSAKGIMRKNVEHAFAYVDGQFLSNDIGSRHSVTFGRSILRQISEQGSKSRITIGHNHLVELGLSPNDMMTSLGYGVTDVFAVTPAGNCHVMTLPRLSDEKRHEIDDSFLWQWYKTIGIRQYCKFLGKEASFKIKTAAIEKFESMFREFGARFNRVKVDELPDLLTRNS